jgi:hypothetical protein
VKVGIFRPFAAFDDQWRANELQRVGMGGEITLDLLCQRRLCLRERFVENQENSFGSDAFFAGHGLFQNQIGGVEGVFRKKHAQIVADLDRFFDSRHRLSLERRAGDFEFYFKTPLTTVIASGLLGTRDFAAMHRKPQVSLAGRLIITAIFALTIFIPEIVMWVTLSSRPGPGHGSGMSFVRLVLAAVLYYFTLQGREWARWLTAFLLIITGAIIIGVIGRMVPPIAIGVAILFISGIAILLGSRIVRTERRIHRDRRSA